MIENSSYEISKRLHDKGFRAEHGHVWDRYGELWRIEESDDKHNILAKPMKGDGCWLICSDPDCKEHDGSAVPAYTFTELWGAMPVLLGNRFELSMGKEWDIKTNIQYVEKACDCHTTLGGSEFSHESPAECAAMMIEWLLDNGHIKLK